MAGAPRPPPPLYNSTPRLISIRSDPQRYLSNSPGLYGFPTTSAEIDFLPAVGQHRASSRNSIESQYSRQQQRTRKIGLTVIIIIKKEAYSVMPSAQMSVSISVSNRDYSRITTFFRIDIPEFETRITCCNCRVCCFEHPQKTENGLDKKAER